MVSDSYDIFNACKHIWGDKLKERVMERSQDSCLVIRPDSGDPAETLIEVHNWTGSTGMISSFNIVNRNWFGELTQKQQEPTSHTETILGHKGK